MASIMQQSRIIAAVEIGTSKVLAVIGELTSDGLELLGVGQSESSGIRKGEIVDMKSATECTHAAMLKAEKHAGQQIEGVYLACTGGHLGGFSNSGHAVVRASDNYVTQQDIERAAQQARSKVLPPGRVYVHHIRSGYTLDRAQVDDPTTMYGEHLEVHYWHVHADEMKIANALRVINGFSLDVDDMILSSVASAAMVLTEEEKRAGVLVCDIGAGATDFILYKNGLVYRSGVVAVGGDHLTNDLSIGLRLQTKQAESIKIRYGSAVMDKEKKDDQVFLMGDLSIGDRPIPLKTITTIIHLRVEEIFMIIKNTLSSGVGPQTTPAGVVLTGGTSRLPGICEVASGVFGVQARIGETSKWVTNPDLRQPEFNTALGLLYFGLKSNSPKPAKTTRGGLMNKIGQLFRI